MQCVRSLIGGREKEKRSKFSSYETNPIILISLQPPATDPTKKPPKKLLK